MAAVKNLSEADLAEIIKLYEEGLNQQEIGRRIGISGTSVRYRLKQAGVYDKQRGKWTEEEKAKMIAMYRAGNILIKDIAKEFGISTYHCGDMLGKWGVERLGSKRKLVTRINNFSEADVVETYKKLRDIEAVAAVYHTSDVTIRTILRRNGMTRVGLKYELNKLIEDNKEYIHKRVSEGSGLITICRELGDINPTTLYKYAKKWGLKTEYPIVQKIKRIFSESKDQMYHDYYVDKMSIEEISKKFGISTFRMWKEISKWGWKMRWSAIDTSIEIFTEKCLVASGVNFVKQFKLGRSKCDFFLPGANLIIETNGDYWHGNPFIYEESEFDDIQRKNIGRDVKKYAAAKEAGYSIIYVWESEIKKRPEEVKAALMTLVANPTSHSSCRDFLLVAK